MPNSADIVREWREVQAAFLDVHGPALVQAIRRARLRSVEGLVAWASTWGSRPEPEFVFLTLEEAREQLGATGLGRLRERMDAIAAQGQGHFPVVAVGNAMRPFAGAESDAPRRRDWRAVVFDAIWMYDARLAAGDA